MSEPKFKIGDKVKDTYSENIYIVDGVLLDHFYDGEHGYSLLDEENFYWSEDELELVKSAPSQTREDIRFLLEQIYDLYTGGEGDFEKIEELALRYNFKLGEYVEDLEEEQ